MFSYEFLHKDAPALSDSLRIYIHQLFANIGRSLKDPTRYNER